MYSNFPSPRSINTPFSWLLDVQSDRWTDEPDGPNEHSCKPVHLHFALKNGVSCYQEKGRCPQASFGRISATESLKCFLKFSIILK